MLLFLLVGNYPNHVLIPFRKKGLTKWLILLLFIQGPVSLPSFLSLCPPRHASHTHNLLTCLLVSLSVWSYLPHLLYKSFHFVFSSEFVPTLKGLEGLEASGIKYRGSQFTIRHPILGSCIPCLGVRVYLGNRVKAPHVWTQLWARYKGYDWEWDIQGPCP